MGKLELDKYYTPIDLAKYCIDKTFEVIGENNINEILEPSAGNGSFSNQIKNCIAIDIEPEDKNINKINFFELDKNYTPNLLIIGNPPYGNCLNTAQKFFKKSVKIADYISFILPISQFNNTQSMYEFDLIYSEDLGKKIYSNRELHCCLNIYARPKNGILNTKPKIKLNDISIYRKDSKDYAYKDFDIRMCCWGSGTVGKILDNNESYSGEYKIKIHNNSIKQDIYNFIINYNWRSFAKGIAMKKLQQYHIIEVLIKEFPQLQ